MSIDLMIIQNIVKYNLYSFVLKYRKNSAIRGIGVRDMMKLLKIRQFLHDAYDYIIVLKRKLSELRKFQDKRRKAIYSKITLTKEQSQMIDDFFINNYGKKIPYTWHRHFMAYTGKFDEKYFPELLYIPEFEHFINYNTEYSKVFQDKSVLPMIVKAVDGIVKTPLIYLSCTQGVYRDKNNRFISRERAVEILEKSGKIFCKPSVDSSSGRGCKIVEICDGADLNTGKDPDSVLNDLGDNFIAQECIKCHPSITEIYAGSVNTFRVITYRWKDKIKHMPVVMRIGKGGSYLDNAHAGGMFVAVSDDGVLHKKAFTEFKIEFERHPDTQLVFEGHIIKYFDRVLEGASQMHQAIPYVGCINWDFTIDQDGNPVLIEGNMKCGSIWLIEMAHGCGAFAENTAEVLQWMRFVRKLPKSKRHAYLFGKMS